RLALVPRIVRPGLDRSLPPERLLVAAHLARREVALHRSVLKFDARMSLEVVVPDRMLGRASQRCHHRIEAIVFDSHQGCLAELAGPGADRCQHDDRATAQAAGLDAIARLVSLRLSTGPASRAWCVVPRQRHGLLPFPAALPVLMRRLSPRDRGRPSAPAPAPRRGAPAVPHPLGNGDSPWWSDSLA